jgi:hypothetical protein
MRYRQASKSESSKAQTVSGHLCGQEGRGQERLQGMRSGEAAAKQRAVTRQTESTNGHTFLLVFLARFSAPSCRH